MKYMTVEEIEKVATSMTDAEIKRMQKEWNNICMPLERAKIEWVKYMLDDYNDKFWRNRK